jgi:hypothetical protein
LRSGGTHDNGQDEFHSDSAGYNESGSAVYNSWLGAMRANPRYPGEPFNDLQASGHDPGCTHADAVQIFAPGITMTGLTFGYDVFGPGVNQGLYPSDGSTGTTFDDVSVRNCLFLDAASSNIITDQRVHGWNLSYDTLFATQGGIEIPGNGNNTISHVIKSAVQRPGRVVPGPYRRVSGTGVTRCPARPCTPTPASRRFPPGYSRAWPASGPPT